MLLPFANGHEWLPVYEMYVTSHKSQKAISTIFWGYQITMNV